MAKNEKSVSLRVDGETPWIGLPAVKADANSTIDEMLGQANLLNWDVRLRDIDTDARPAGGQSFEVIRTNPYDGLLDRLAIVGERYVPVQVEELADMAKTITSGDVRAEIVGSYRNGRSVFLVFTLGENIVVDPNGSADEIGQYLTIMSSNDGTSGIVAMTHNMRIVCQNMLTSARSAALSTFKMRHTASVHGRILDARKALEISFKESEIFKADMAALSEIAITNDKFDEIVKAVYKKPEDDAKASLTRWQTKTDEIWGLWNGPTLAEVDNTAYKAYNALNEHLMWYSPIRAENTESSLARAGGFDDLTNRKNVDLYRAVSALV